MRRFLRIVCHSQLWIAVSAALFLFICARLLGRELPLAVYGAAFCWAWAVYLTDSGLGSSREDLDTQPERAKFLRKYSWLLYVVAPLSAIAAGALLLTHLETWRGWTLAAALVLLGAGYALPLIPWHGWKRLKEIGIGKTPLVTLGWAVGGIGFALIVGERTGNGTAAPILAVIGYLVLLLFLDALSADFRDITGDQREGTKTAASALGRFAWFALIFGVLLAGFLWITPERRDARWSVAGIMWFASLVSILTIKFHKRDETLFTIAISAWRFLGAAALAMVIV